MIFATTRIPRLIFTAQPHHTPRHFRIGVAGTAPVASTYRHFDLETLAKGVASIPVPGEKSNHQFDVDSVIDGHDPVIGVGGMEASRVWIEILERHLVNSKQSRYCATGATADDGVNASLTAHSYFQNGGNWHGATIFSDLLWSVIPRTVAGGAANYAMRRRRRATIQQLLTRDRHDGEGWGLQLTHRNQPLPSALCFTRRDQWPYAER